MASIFQRALNVARANLGPAVERGLRSAVDGAVRRAANPRTSARPGRSTRGSGTGRGFPGLGGARPRSSGNGPVHAGPAEVRTVEVGGVPVRSKTRPYDVAREGLPRMIYAPQRDGEADPGEVVWTWIPFDDDPSQGKDRPALVLARDGASLVCAQLTSRDRARGSVTHDEYGRVWFDVGTGGWDREGRPSEVRLDRLWLVRVQDVRREGAALARERFDDVVTKLRQLHG